MNIRAFAGTVMVFASAVLVAGSASAMPRAVSPSAMERSTAMEVLGAAKPPIGYVEFCRANPGDCPGPEGRPVRIVMTPASFAELDQLNRYVNARIQPATDMEIYGVEEKWAYPAERGDCEDYVLLKRRMLIDSGWPASALLISVVRDEKGDGHAVLTAVSDRGDYVLDNQRDDIRAWSRTGYDFVKRQSQSDPRRWVYVGGADLAAGVASAR